MFNSHRNYGMIKCLHRLLEIQQETLDKMCITYPKYWVKESVLAKYVYILNKIQISIFKLLFTIFYIASNCIIFKFL
jgi:hypothetical protein